MRAAQEGPSRSWGDACAHRRHHELRAILSRVARLGGSRPNVHHDSLHLIWTRDRMCGGETWRGSGGGGMDHVRSPPPYMASASPDCDPTLAGWLCSRTIPWGGSPMPKQPAARGPRVCVLPVRCYGGGCARAVLVRGGVSRGYTHHLACRRYSQGSEKSAFCFFCRQIVETPFFFFFFYISLMSYTRTPKAQSAERETLPAPRR